jgi:hypothetical protein
MNSGNWIALLGIAVTFLAICVPVLVTLILRGKDAHKAELAQRDAVIAKQLEIIERQRETIFDNKISLGQLAGTSEAVNRLLRAIPIPQQSDGTGQ